MSAYQTPKRRRLDTARSRIGQYIYEGVRQYGARAVGGFAAAAAGHGRNLGADFANAAADMITNASHSATSAMRGAAERVVNGMSGGTAMNIGESSMVPAQIIPGRGAELSYQQLNVLKAIKFKTGEPAGASAVSAYGREPLMYGSQPAIHAFAFKMQLTPPSFLSSGGSVPVNRFYCHNVFRHVLQGVNNTSTSVSNMPYGGRTQSWNETLGPDKSYVRQLGALTAGGSLLAGSGYVDTPAALGLNKTLQSPFRYPQNGAFMFSRMTRQLLENLGWNANPLKFILKSPGSQSTPYEDYVSVYGNAPATTGPTISSIPYQVPQNSTVGNEGPSFFYRSQLGRGQVSYCFNNDGTNPVVIDIVITRIKKGQQVLKKDLGFMVGAYQQGYLNYALASRAQANLEGQQPLDVDVTTNARCAFLPAKALDNYRLTPAAGTITNSSSAPFKQVARDQFIISGGATRNWSTYLQSIDYDARKFAQFQAPVAATDTVISTYDAESNCLDEFSYIFSIACSGVPAPYVEYKGLAGNAASVIDRRGTECSVSVTGCYKEVCHPVYISKVNNEPFINGRLDISHFDPGTTQDPSPSITTNDIANIGQAVRGTTTQSALIGMGPFNTAGGG